MSTYIKTLKDQAGNNVMPRTKANAVTDSNNITVAARLDDLDAEMLSVNSKIPSEASSENPLVDTVTANNTYQKKLTAGQNITIQNNVISAAGAVEDVKVNGSSVVTNKVANVDIPIVDTKVNGTSVVTNRVANIVIPQAAVEDVTVDGVSVIDNKIAKITTDPVLANAKTNSGIGWTEGSTDHQIATKYIPNNHTHNNKGVIDSITGTMVGKWNTDETTTNKVTSVSASSTHTQYPTAKLLYDTATALDTRITNLQNLGRYLALWDCTTGLPTTNPTTMPYTYKAGDYYRISTVPSPQYFHKLNFYISDANTVTFYMPTSSSTSPTVQEVYNWLKSKGATSTSKQNAIPVISGYYGSSRDIIEKLYIFENGGPGASGPEYTFLGFILIGGSSTEANRMTQYTLTDQLVTLSYGYKPSGSSYNGTASKVLETEMVAAGDVYFYDGTSWTLQINHSQDVYTKAETDTLLSQKANKTTIATSTMTSANWSGNTYSFESTYPVATYDIEIELAPTATLAQAKAYGKAMITGSANSNIVTAIGTVPTVNIPILITVEVK